MLLRSQDLAGAGVDVEHGELGTGPDGEVPDPQHVESFELSKLTPREPEQLYVDLLRLRRELPRELDVSFDEAARTLELRRGRATLRADFAGETVDLRA